MQDFSESATAVAPMRPRLRKRPHELHLCTTPEELSRALRASGIDPLAIVAEFVRPSTELGILAAGSIPWGVATELSDLDIWVLLPGSHVFRSRQPREIAGAAVKYMPNEKPNRTGVTLFLSGIEIDFLFYTNDVPPQAEAGGLKASQAGDVHAADPSFVTRLATGWTLHGPEIVDRWKSYYDTDSMRLKWIASEFTAATKDLEDLEVGIGRDRGHVPAIGSYVANSLLRALLAYNGCYTTSVKSMLRIGRLIETADPEMRDALIEGRALAFPALLHGPDEERAYFDRVYAYCGAVRTILSREEGMADILDSVIHDLDIIL